MVRVFKNQLIENVHLHSLTRPHFRTTEKSRDAILALGAVTPIILQLQSADIQLRQMALKALLLLSEYPKGLSAIFASGVTSRLVTVVAFSTEKADVIYALKLMLQLARSGTSISIF